VKRVVQQRTSEMKKRKSMNKNCDGDDGNGGADGKGVAIEENGTWVKERSG
jgi:hypothetical protein